MSQLKAHCDHKQATVEGAQFAIANAILLVPQITRALDQIAKRTGFPEPLRQAIQDLARIEHALRLAFPVLATIREAGEARGWETQEDGS